jgi:hypothetical protein
MRAILIFSLILATPVTADSFSLGKCEEQATSGWAFYCDPDPVPEEEMVEEAAPGPTPAPAPTPETATEQMMSFRAHVDELKYRAVLDPTEENVRAYITVQKQMIDQAGHFTDQWQRVIFGSPDLSVTDDFPMSAAGIGVYQDQIKAVRDETFREVATTSGIIFIFEDDSRCGMCRAQGEILAQMQDWYEVSVLAVMSQLLCRFIKKFLQDSSRMKRNSTRYFTFRFQFLTRVSTSERLGQKMEFRSRGAAGS